MNGCAKRVWMAALGIGLTVGAGPAWCGDGSWNANANGNWSGVSNWVALTPADGSGATAWFTNNISAARTVTNDGAVRWLGALNVGDADGSHAFTIAGSSGSLLAFTNNGVNAQLNQTVTSKGDTISAALALADALDVVNVSSNVFTIAGAITNVTSGIKTLSNIGNGSVMLSGPLVNGAGPLSLVQNSSASLLTLSASNSLTGGLGIKAGTVKSTVLNGLGAGTNLITLGDSSGSARTMLIAGAFVTNANPMLVASGNSGEACISNNVTSVFSGPVTLDAHDLTLASCAWANTLSFWGSIGGTGNLLLKPSGPLSVASVMISGVITNAGVATYGATITGTVGSNVTALVENSPGSGLTVSGPLTVNGGGTTLVNVNPGGGAALTVSGSITGTGNLTLSNNSAVADGVVLSGALVNPAGAISNSGVGPGNTLISAQIGALVSRVVQGSPDSMLVLSGANTYSGGLWIKAGWVKAANIYAGGTNASVITLGDTSGSADATLALTIWSTYPNPIVVASNNTGTAMMLASNNVTYGGAVTLNNHDLVLFMPDGPGTGSRLEVAGGVTGSGNLICKADAGRPVIFQTLPVNQVGTLTNLGLGTATTTISGGVGANVTAITQASASSPLTLDTKPITVGAGGTILACQTAGNAPLTVSGGVNGTGDLILRNNSALNYGITLSGLAVSPTGQVVNVGAGTGSSLISATLGASASVVQNSASSELVLATANSCTGALTVAAGTLRVSNPNGSASGSGTLTIQNGGTLAGTGLVAATTVMMAGGIVSPGPGGTSRGILTASNLVWNGGGIYRCKVASIVDGGAGAGIDYDQLVLTGTLTAAPSGSNLVIRLDSLGQTLPFDPGQNYSLRLLTYAAAPGLNVNDITLDTTAFLAGGTWSLTNLNKSLYAVFWGALSSNRNYWVGSGNWSTATNWSLGHAPQAGEDVEFNFSSLANCTADVVTNALGSLTLSAGYTGTITLQTRFPGLGAFTNVWITGDCTLDGGVLTHAFNASVASNRLMLTIGGNLTIGTNGQINADGRGYAPGKGPGAAPVSAQRSYGPSHGGLGGHGYNLAKPPGTYGSAYEPITLGSGGYTNGGGSVCVVVGGATRLEGSISARGAQSGGRNPGAAGGSVFLTTGSLEGTGQTIAAGRGNTDGTDSSGAGGGGRVAIILTASSSFGNVRISAPGIRDSSNAAGAAGTVYLQTQTQGKGEGTLIIDNAGSSATYVTCTLMPEPSAFNDAPDLTHLAAIVVTNGGVLGLNTNTVYDFGSGNLRPQGLNTATVMINGTNGLSFPDPFVVSTNYRLLINTTITATGDWLVPSNAVLSHLSNYYAENYKLGLVLNGNLTVSTGGVISADGRGYAAASGPGAGTSGNNGVGASYGGMGGWGGPTNTPTGPPARTYGSVTAPTQCGSGANLAGSGAVLLDVRGTTTVYGVMSARQTNNLAGQGGASGGTIWLRTSVLQGTGLLDVSGQPASYSSSASVGSGGGGGGGRLVVVLTGSDTFGGVQMNAAGGPNTTASYVYDSAAAGTIYTETRSQGSLRGQVLIANANRDLGPVTNIVTWLPAPTNAVAGELTYVTVVLSNRAYVALSTNLTIGDLYIRTNTPNTLYLKGRTLTVNRARHPDWGSTNNVVADGGQIVWKAASSVLLVQ